MKQPLILLDTNVVLYFLGGRLANPLPSDARSVIFPNCDRHSPEFVNSDRFTVDHIIPQSLGDSDELENLALCCRRCNERR